MNNAILNEFNKLRIREQRKLLFQIHEHLDETKPGDQSLISDLITKLVRITRENQHDINYNTALANYNKLSSALLLISGKNKRISSNLETIKKFQPLFWRLFQKLFPVPGKAFQTIEDDLKEINLKIKTYLPEQLTLKPLGPFNFTSGKVEIIKGMISIIVLNENGADHLKNLFDSFIKYNSFKNFNFVILDRGSSDHSIDLIKSYNDKLPLELIPFEEKLTNSYLYNLAVDAVKSEFLLFLNNKVIFKDDVLPLFIDEFSKDANYGAIGASLNYSNPDDKFPTGEHYGSFRFAAEDVPGHPDIQENGTPGTWLTCLKAVAATHPRLSGSQIVPAISGSAMMCKREDFMMVDGFDLNYYNGQEDIDLCLKFARKLDKKSLLVNEIALQLDCKDIIHEIGVGDEIGSYYNLGVMLNMHGYFIKNKYLEDIINNDRFWTNEGNENLAGCKKFIESLGPNPETVNISNYLTGFRDKKFRIAVKIAASDDDRAQFWGDYHFAHALKKAFIKKGHPARVDLFESWHESGYLTDDVVIVLRGIKQYQTRGSQINILWNISHPEQISESEYRDFDHVFVASGVFAGELAATSGFHAETLLQCTDPDLFYPDTNPLKEEEKTDILFVGNSRGVLRKSIDFIMQKGIPVTIYGTGWGKILPPEMIKGNFIKNEELRRYYSNCNILLNDHWDDMVKYGFISNRLFDALACGAIVLTDPVKGIEDTFNEGLYFYNNADELSNQVTWIRGHFEEAKRLVSGNINKVLENHTFDHRVEKILEVVGRIHQRKMSGEK